MFARISFGLAVVLGVLAPLLKAGAAENHPPVRELRCKANEVAAVAFSPDGRMLATAGDDKRIVLWEVETGKERAVLEGHQDRITSLAFRGDSTTLVSASTDGTVRVWDLVQQKVKQTLSPWQHGRGLRHAVSADGKFAAIFSHEDLQVWDLTAERLVKPVKGGEYGPETTVMSADAKLLACAAGKVTLFDLEKGERRFVEGEARHFRVAGLSADAKWLAVSDDNVQVIDIATGELAMVIRAGLRWVRSIAFTPDGKQVALGFDRGIIRILDVSQNLMTEAPVRGAPPRLESEQALKDRQFQRTLELGIDAAARHRHQDALKFFERAKSLRPTDPEAVRRHAQTKKLLDDLKWHFDEVNTLNFSPDGQSLATGGHDQTAKIWDLATGKVRWNLIGHTARVTSVAYSEDGKTLYSASKDGTVKTWDTTSGKLLETLAPWKATRWDLLTISPNACFVAMLSIQGELQVWNLEKRERTSSLNAARGHAEAMAVAPDGKQVVYAGGDVTFWNLEKKQSSTLSRDGGHYRAVGISPDGKTIAVSPGHVLLLEAATQRELGVIEPRAAWVRSIAFSRDGKKIAIGLDDGLIKVGNLSTPAAWTDLGRGR